MKQTELGQSLIEAANEALETEQMKKVRGGWEEAFKGCGEDNLVTQRSCGGKIAYFLAGVATGIILTCLYIL